MEYIRNMARHAWKGYHNHAFGHDELRPHSKTFFDWHSPYSILHTPIDSLDTFLIMNLETEYTQAKEIIFNSTMFNGTYQINVSFFETVIRIIGGLLSVYDLNGDQKVLELCVKLADVIVENGFSFDDIEGQGYGGFPSDSVSLRRGSRGYGSGSNLAGIGSNQLEFQYLTDVTGNPIYEQKSLYVFEKLRQIKLPVPGLFPTYIPSGQTDMSECGMFSLGGRLNPINPHHKMNKVEKVNKKLSELKQQEVGKELTDSCIWSYFSTETGLGAEVTNMELMKADYPKFHLRPEVIESIFYMWRFTHDPIYREKGWEIVMALEKHCKAPDGGYYGLDDVNNPKSKDDRMNSFFIAETLKYLYLLYTDDDVIPLEKYVFNTEAHPLSVRGHGRRRDPRKLKKVAFSEE
ncbi:Mannosyl-oligosaccharide 1,2-alpha-mannosidase IC [Blyttiomyces sp. JEL0837]|nr:Mannosyl-oligosaccharide 1,2-alpha-mannosidase IC [Blyttiomyces sp. JEL0837]